MARTDRFLWRFTEKANICGFMHSGSELRKDAVLYFVLDFAKDV